MSAPDVDLSIVIPVYNEEGSLGALIERLIPVLEAMQRSFEVVFVDDGSTDASLDMLRGFREHDRRVRVIRMMRNFGQTPALYAGFSRVRGAIIVMIDADLQNPPEAIPDLVAKIEEGYEAVSGWRQRRDDPGIRKFGSRVINRIIAWLTASNIHDWGCAFKAYRRDFIERLNSMEHSWRYLPADITWLTSNVGEVRVPHAPRVAGVSKYPPSKLLRTAFDLLTALSIAPLQIITFTGIALGGLGGLVALLSAAAYLVGLAAGTGAAFAFLFGVFLVVSGIQLLAMGLLAEYVGRIYLEARRRPAFVVREELA